MIRGFQITEKIHEAEHSVVYRAIRKADDCRVVLKVLNSQYPTRRGLARYRQEYDILGALHAPGVIRAHGLERLGNTTLIVLEDFGAVALNRQIRVQRPGIEQLLALAIQAAGALGYIHGQGVIHKDINPSNLVWNPETRQLKIIDFGIATRLSNESPTLKAPDIIEGTLPYVSPEQTGRMNRRLDYRSDFYSLGVTLYELLTGQLPFDRDDALELVHCHLAAQPRPPIELREDIPPMLSRIVLKLLAKTAEDRYQSARGLEADLVRCLDQVRAGQETDSFPLGREDSSDRLTIPQKLYGRAREIAALLDVFDLIAQGGRACILVTGYSGTGKSSLVRELYKPITRKNAFFVSGKFDLLQRATPYSALANACSELVKQLLTRSKDELRQWRAALLDALGPNGRILVALIPELALVIGDQPAVEELGPVEARNRLHLAFADFLRVFCQPAHPLVVFLDDLQWIDSATLGLLEAMIADEQLTHFLLIGAYRDNEVDAAHPLAVMLQSLDDRGCACREIHVPPLGMDEVREMLADALHQPAPSVRALAELMLRRTGGNPFFLGEFLDTLHREGLLRFDIELPGWRWDTAAIEATPVTDSVVELLSPKLRRFPADIQALLRLAACMGNRFDLETLALVADRPLAETAGALLAAVQEGFILPAAEPQIVEAEGAEPQLLVHEYRFAHDRVQQAAYSLIPADERAAIHLHIGHLLRTRLRPEEQEERLFELVDHLDLGRACIDTAAGEHAVTALDLARLELAAGQRAREAAAFAAAARYLSSGLELIGDAWDEHFDLALDLHVEGALAEHCQGNHERSQALIRVVLGQAAPLPVKARLYRISIVQHTNQGSYEEAFRVAREGLALLGQTLVQPHELSTAVPEELGRIAETLGDRSIESLADAPEMSDDIHKAALELLSELLFTAYLTNVEMYAFVSARMVNLMLEHGPCAVGLLGYTSHALTIGIKLDAYQRGYRFGALALRLADRFHNMAAWGKVAQTVITVIWPWSKPLKEAHSLFPECFEVARQMGDLQFASFNLVMRQRHDFHMGTSLARVLEESDAFVQISKRHQTPVVTDLLEGIRMVAAHLSDDGAHDDMTAVEGDAGYLARCTQTHNFQALGAYHLARCQALYLYQDYPGALRAATEASALRDYMAGTISVAVLDFYHSLCLTALYPQSTPAQQTEFLRTLQTHQRQMNIWAESCPENFRHMYLLVDAEMARITGDYPAAMERYAQAVEAAELSELRQDVALANDLAAHFFLSRGQTRYAMFHMRDAHYSYGVWGARRKLALLEAHHGHLLVHPWKQDDPPSREPHRTTHSTTSSTSTSEQLDLASVLKASQALSSEISLDKLMARLIDIVIESAGAQHGFLILERRDQLVIEARGTMGGQEIEVLTSLPLDAQAPGGSLVSPAIVHYVLRSRETVVLPDAAREGPFVSDPHVVATRARSILCMPLRGQGQVNGVVYLENNLSPGAFTPARVELLALLLVQMAISLDNSLLYGNLQQATRALERLLHSIAHDLKEPLRSVQSFSELLLRRCGAQIDDKGHDYLTRVVNAGLHLGKLLDAIRTISEIRRGAGAREQVPGERLIEEALKRLRPAIEQARATVHVAGALPPLTVQRRWAVEAIYQLVHNALQHHGPGQEPEIDIARYDGSEGVGLVVMDRGPGIPEPYAERVFELFRRAVGRDVPGTGAGLAIVRQIAAKHGGNAWIGARAGGGTEAYITFGS